jgi:hypothetical protein
MTRAALSLFNYGPLTVASKHCKMKDRFALTRPAYPEHQSRRQHALALGRWYQRAGRVCLVAAAISGGIDIYSAVRGGLLPPVTLRSVLNLSPDVTAPGSALIRAAIELAVDTPLWILLVVAAAIPYTLAVHRFVKENPHR